MVCLNKYLPPSTGKVPTYPGTIPRLIIIVIVIGLSLTSKLPLLLVSQDHIKLFVGAFVRFDCIESSTYAEATKPRKRATSKMTRSAIVLFCLSQKINRIKNINHLWIDRSRTGQAKFKQMTVIIQKDFRTPLTFSYLDHPTTIRKKYCTTSTCTWIVMNLVSGADALEAIFSIGSRRLFAANCGCDSYL
jgi:hypothetical protein